MAATWSGLAAQYLEKEIITIDILIDFLFHF